ERVGRQDNFFELGGHSILAMQVAARLQACLSRRVPIKTVFEFPVLQELALQLHQDGDAEMEELMATVASLSEGKVQELLSELGMESAP
ncbi:phosphopantetheine-binding protein, partial [Steroidobacter flavus]